MAVVHGVAGSGEVRSAAGVQRGGRRARRVVVAVDGRAVEPTPQGFLAAVEPALGADGPVVLMVDTAERLRLLDGWLRQTFLPSLPEHARVVLATRDAPGAVWRSSFGELLRAVPLGPLSPAAAAEVLRGAGLDEPQAEWVNRFVRGHPLSLQLAASAIRERPDAPEDAVLPTVVQELAALYLDGLDPATREALDATSVLRRVTLSLLGALLPDEPPQEPFARLAALPFVELGREGLVVHDTVRETVGALLRATDPVRHRAYRAAAWRQIRHELAGAAGAARWASLADMIALVDEPLVREAFFPSAVQHYAVETARPDDRDAIVAIAARHEPPEEVALVRAWWDEVPGAFRVARDPRGRVVAFTALCELAEVPQRLLMRDPLYGPWRRHLRAHPVPRASRSCSPASRSRTAPARRPRPASPRCCATSSARRSRPARRLRRIYSHGRGDGLLTQLEPVGFAALPDCPEVELGGVGFRPIVCDFGPESVTGWLSGLAARDLPVGATVLDEDARELVLDGRRVALTKLECDVLGHLREREDQPVAREALLREVWGYEWTGGSNVVDVAVSGLRRKLGDRAAALETVRGVGYRLRRL